MNSMHPYRSSFIFLGVIEGVNLVSGSLSVRVVRSYVNQLNLSLREFVFFRCNGKNLRRGRQFLIMADMKVEGNLGRLETTFMKRWGVKTQMRLERWMKLENRCDKLEN